MPSLKPGGGVEGRKIRERQVDALGKRRGEGGREPAAPLRTLSPGLLLSCEAGQMRASTHFYDSTTANGLKQDKEANSTPGPLTEKAIRE